MTRVLGKGHNQKVVLSLARASKRGDQFYSIFIKVVPSDIFTSGGYHMSC